MTKKWCLKPALLTLSLLLLLAPLSAVADAATGPRGQVPAEGPSFGYLIRYQKSHAFGALTVDDQPVMTFPGVAGIQQAQTLARTLNNMRPLKPELFRPGLKGGDFIIRYGKRPLVTIDDRLANAHKDQPASLLLRWLEQLRLALGGRPLWRQASSTGPVQLYRQGIASYYNDWFHGRTTANGEIYDRKKLTAAHLTLPFGTLVLVTNVVNNKSVIVRINDRGPFDSRFIIDLSHRSHNAIRAPHDDVDLLKVRMAVLKG